MHRKSEKNLVLPILFPLRLCLIGSLLTGVLASAQSESRDIQLSTKVRNSRSVELDDNRKIKPRDLELTITARGKLPAQATEFGFLRITELTGRDNRPLQVKSPVNPFFDPTRKYLKVENRKNGFFGNHPLDGVSVRVEIKRPEPEAGKIARIRGSFEIRYPVNARLITIPKALSTIGKVESDELNKLGISVELGRPRPDTLTVGIAGSGKSSVQVVRVRNAKNQPLDDLAGASWATVLGRKEYRFAFKRLVPADATIFILVGDKLEKKIIPFEFENVPYPESPSR